MENPISKYKYAYFLGIGGIGMSAIARYFNATGIKVFGYDKTETSLTKELQKEGMQITFIDSIETIPSIVLENSSETMFVLTPAIPKEHLQWNYFKQSNFPILKRSEVLGLISENSYCIAVAGTHGKTTTSTFIAHILNESNVNFTAFLGGISANFNSNYFHKTDGINLLEKPIVVLEADEFDRSFHRLSPDCAIITAIDPDHLDIYGTADEFLNAFQIFADKVEKNGHVILQKKLQISSSVSKFTYAINDSSANFNSNNISIKNGNFIFDWHDSNDTFPAFTCGLPGFHNVENATAAIAVCYSILGININLISKAVLAFKGAKRRFEYVFQNENYTVIDDYAHHPQELEAFIGSVKALYPNKKITGIFQPHLYSRTRDFGDGFAEVLSTLDETWLMPIYPAREKPIDGITSGWLLEKIANTNKKLIPMEKMLDAIKETKPALLLIMGAGDIDTLVLPIKKIYDEMA